MRPGAGADGEGLSGASEEGERFSLAVWCFQGQIADRETRRFPGFRVLGFFS